MQSTENISYKIGTVSRITGIGTETLRAWERRYQAVVPLRNESGGRNYSKDDVEKLFLLKSLTDNGFSIGNVAKLKLEDLKDLSENNHSLNTPTKTHDSASITEETSCQIVLVGDGFPLRVLDGLEEIKGIKVTGTYNSLEELQNKSEHSANTSIVIFEKPTLNSQTSDEVYKLRELTGAWHVIVLYGFANQQQIEKLQSTQTSVIRSSIDVQELGRLCIFQSGGSEKLPQLVPGSTLHYEQTIPSRIFSNQQLAKLASISSTIKCECPKHISDLVRDLVAFETYSAECENENQQDAALHGYLHAITSQARSMLEEAMSHLIRVEGIDIHKQ